MGEASIIRRQRNQAFTLSTATSAATTIRLDNSAGGVVSVGTMSTSASKLQIFGSDQESGSYRRLYDSFGSPADITMTPSTSVGTMYALPDPAFALPYMKIVSGDTNSTGFSGVVMLKS